MMAISANSEHPEAAMKFINLCFASKEIVNLYVWGTEGVDYVFNADGTISYATGDNMTVSYVNADWFGLGNWFNMYLQTGYPPTYRMDRFESMKTKPVSPYMGFASDLSEYTSLKANISDVTNKYVTLVDCGLYTPELYKEFTDALETAGIRQYIDVLQGQLDSWLANK